MPVFDSNYDYVLRCLLLVFIIAPCVMLIFSAILYGVIVTWQKINKVMRNEYKPFFNPKPSLIRGKTFLYAKKERPFDAKSKDVAAVKYKYLCSKCGKSTYLGSEYDFCPYCGRTITGIFDMEKLIEESQNGKESSV